MDTSDIALGNPNCWFIECVRHAQRDLSTEYIKQAQGITDVYAIDYLSYTRKITVVFFIENIPDIYWESPLFVRQNSSDRH